MTVGIVIVQGELVGAGGAVAEIPEPAFYAGAGVDRGIDKLDGLRYAIGKALPAKLRL